jgi:hypothetical protein
MTGGLTMRKLWDGREFVKINSANDKNGNKVSKVFFPDGHTEIIKDARLPITSDKWYKSLSGMRKSK